MSEFRFQTWLALRYLKTAGIFVNTTSWLAIVGMSVGVACMVLAMGVVSGFETTLKRSVIDSVGELMVARSGGGVSDPKALEEKIRQIEPRVRAVTPFVHLEGLVASKGRFSGAVIQGLDPNTVEQVLNLRARLRQGQFELLEGAEPTILIGKTMAEKLGVGVGQTIQLVVPRLGVREDEPFRPQTQKLRVAGILDFGKYDYDLRFGMVNIAVAQRFRSESGSVTGLRLKLSSPEEARPVSFQLTKELGSSFWTRDWRETNENLFSAIQLEKVVIFLIPLFMVIAAGFNIASTLYILVLKKFQDIAVLKTLGSTQSFLVRLFCLQGLLLGLVGAAFGVLLGVGLGEALLHTTLQFIPPEVYKLDHLTMEIRWTDMLAILIASTAICFISTLAPALRAARLKPVEGIRYE